jgi:hypothetical protein
MIDRETLPDHARFSDTPGGARRLGVLKAILNWCDRSDGTTAEQCLHEIENLVRKELGLR